jgi:hexosaminidase
VNPLCRAVNPLVFRAALFVCLFFASVVAVVEAQRISIIPRPASVSLAAGEFVLDSTTVVLTDRKLRPIGQLLIGWLAPSTGLPLQLKRGARARPNSICLKLDPSLSPLGQEGYRLDVTPESVVIRAPHPAGVFYGVQSLRQLLPPQVFADSLQRAVRWAIPAVSIEDAPRFSWRGALLDVSRHFMPKQTVMKFIDLFALHKLNVLHWHLTDDQGWRIQIKKYPLLTKIGSIRKETRVGHERDAKGFDGTPHGGFYTQDEIREIVEYARRRFVTIVPEIEMPGHAQAAIAAYPELGNTGQRLEVSTHWGVHKNIYSVSEQTIRFLQAVLKEVLDLFPSKFIHVGGDEIRKDQWKTSPEAQARIKQLGLRDEQDLQTYFIRRMAKFLSSHKRRLVGWDDILERDLPREAVVTSWRGTEGAITAARAGYDVIMATSAYTYLDHYQSKDKGEPLAIGDYLPLDTVYSFDPVPRDLTELEARHILGAQGQLWTEYISDQSQLEYMAFPRLIALAEVTWTPTENRVYRDFWERLKFHEQRLRQLQVNFKSLVTN